GPVAPASCAERYCKRGVHHNWLIIYSLRAPSLPLRCLLSSETKRGRPKGGSQPAFGSMTDERVTRWLRALEERHLSNLTAAEVARALRALSSCYVERRAKLATGGALETAG